MAGPTRLELATSGVTVRHSNQTELRPRKPTPDTYPSKTGPGRRQTSHHAKSTPALSSRNNEASSAQKPWPLSPGRNFYCTPIHRHERHGKPSSRVPRSPPRLTHPDADCNSPVPPTATTVTAFAGLPGQTAHRYFHGSGPPCPEPAKKVPPATL